MFAVKLAGAGVAGSVLQRRGQLIDGQIARGHRGRVRLDANGGLSAIDGDLAHARENANALADLRIGVVEELARVALSLVIPTYMMGWSFGLVLVKVGGLGKS